MQSVCIYASQLASCIGYNRFKKQCDALETVWKRVDPDGFAAALRRNHIKTQEEAVLDIMTSNDTVRSILVQAESAINTTSNDVARGYEIASSQLASSQLGVDEWRMVDDTVRKTLYTTFGNRREHDALQHVSETIQACRPDETFYRARVAECDGVEIFVGGKLDGLSDDGTTIVELKNRVNRLFYKIPMYEVVQVQAYLHVVPTATNACLVECLTRDDGSIVTNTVHMRRDDFLWKDDIVPSLCRFVRVLLRVLSDVPLQDAYLQSRHRQSFFNQVATAIPQPHP